MASRTTPAAVPAQGVGGIPRSAVIAQVWQDFGSAVVPLSNAAGRPSARTLKLIVDPLVIRPVQNPHLAGGFLSPDQTAELADRLRSAREVLGATAAWFVELKRSRRTLGVTEGNPQDLYFQRCFELATAHGHPDDDSTSEEIAANTVLDVQRSTGESLLAQVRALLTSNDSATRFERALHTAWASRPSAPGTVDHEDVCAALDACPEGGGTAEFDALVDGRAGRAGATRIEADGAARDLGLSDRALVGVPALGASATKRDLPRPFDRSIFERLFADLSSGSNRDVWADAEAIVDGEIARSAAPWQLTEEDSRVMMLLGSELARGLGPHPLPDPTVAHDRLRARWDREAHVRRALRLPAESSGVPSQVRADILDVHRNYVRRLWVRMHGREIRESVGIEVWDVLDGVLRSVIMDQRHRLKRTLVEQAASA